MFLQKKIWHHFSKVRFNMREISWNLNFRWTWELARPYQKAREIYHSNNWLFEASSRSYRRMETLVQAMWIIPSFDSHAPWWNGKRHFVCATLHKISFRVKLVLPSMQIPMWFSQNQLMNSGRRWNLSKKVKSWRLLPQRVMLLVDQDSMKILFNMIQDYFKSILVRTSLKFHFS